MTILHAVVGIIKRTDKILVAERPVGKSYSGYWEFPGGKIEENESDGDALHRELQEELGIEVISAYPGFSHLHTYPDKTVSLKIWLVTAFSGEPQSRENQTLRWVTLQDISSLPMLEGNWAILKRINLHSAEVSSPRRREPRSVIPANRDCP
jgi:8-oxo-dGTP diphosphatase